jgi:hypothetical protein
MREVLHKTLGCGEPVKLRYKMNAASEGPFPNERLGSLAVVEMFVFGFAERL